MPALSLSYPKWHLSNSWVSVLDQSYSGIVFTALRWFASRHWSTYFIKHTCAVINEDYIAYTEKSKIYSVSFLNLFFVVVFLFTDYDNKDNITVSKCYQKQNADYDDMHLKQ